MAWERKSKATPFWLTFLFFSLFIGLFLRFTLLPAAPPFWRYSVANGVVIATDGPRPVVEYAVAGMTHSVTGACDCEFGEEVPVYYSPLNPARAWLEYPYNDRLSSTILILLFTGFASAALSWHLVYNIAPRIFRQQ